MNINRQGFIGSIIVHGLLAALLILGGLTFPDPPPEEEGILVNFGTDDTGSGFVEPEGDETQAGTPDPVAEEITEEVAEEVQEEVQETTPAPTEPTRVDNTQDVEETPVKEEPQPTEEELRRQQEERERRQRELEEQRRREEEQRKREAEQRKRQEQADRLNNLGESTFGRQGTGEDDGSQGIQPGEGTNQGSTTGSPGATNYGEGSGLGDGISYGLGGRKVEGVTKPNVDNCEVTSRIIVTVEIQVDRDGKVVSANVSNATFADKCIWDRVIEAARNTKFVSDPNATFKQKGWIRYTIEP